MTTPAVLPLWYATIAITFLIPLYWSLSTMSRNNIPGPRTLKLFKAHNFLIDMCLVLSKGSKIAQKLHKRYGPVVQISRDRVLINDSNAIREVYAVSHRLDRPIPLAMFHNYGTENLVSIQDGDVHHERRRPIRSIYSVSAVGGEKTQDIIAESIARFKTHLLTVAGLVDIRIPLRLMLYEMMSALIYGRHYGMKLFDDAEARQTLEKDIKYQDNRLFSLSGVLMAFFPKFILWLRRHRLAPALMSGHWPAGLLTDRIAKEALQSLQDTSHDAPDAKLVPTRQETLFSRMHTHLTTHGPTSAVPSQSYLLSDCADHMWAGVSTTLDVLVPLIKHLSQPSNSGRQKRLRKELSTSKLFSPDRAFPSTDELARLLYLDACIRETLRLHPPAPIALDRKITSREGSIAVCGHAISKGMSIGASPFLLGRNEGVYGRDLDEWRPERWIPFEPKDEMSSGGAASELPADDEANAAKERLKAMKQHLFAFGAGPRMCLGVNVAWAAMRATIAGIYSEFETGLAVKDAAASQGSDWWWQRSLSSKKGQEKITVKSLMGT